jgi:hypothetical protein
MPGAAAGAAGAVLLAKHEFSGKGINYSAMPHLEAGQSDCRESGCKYRHISKQWLFGWVEHWAISSWHHSELWLTIVAAVDGCNVRQANIYVSGKSFIKVYADQVVWNVSVIGCESVDMGVSDCRDCCIEAACVDFDVLVNLDYNFIANHPFDPHRVRISGGAKSGDDIQIFKL